MLFVTEDNMKTVIFTGCDQSQHSWGNHTGDYTKLVIGQKYRLKKEEERSWHTKYFLDGIDGSFNSVCFD
jgi:hypothetical protein